MKVAYKLGIYLLIHNSRLELLRYEHLLAICLVGCESKAVNYMRGILNLAQKPSTY